MSWETIKPILSDAELYSSLLVNVYAILFAVTYSVRWLIGRARKVSLPPGDIISTALSDALTVLVALALVSVTAIAMLSLFDLGAIESWLKGLLPGLW
jgi:hypothetical protein